MSNTTRRDILKSLGTVGTIGAVASIGGAPMVFVERPISATMLVLSGLLLVVLALPAIRKKREETFVED